ncbi:E3 ubiquitin-protein ligase TOM1-like [Astathelohania contejeani]|uniref:HECT-type E3 ubiquitin transferase n=1 Tax=Astathelohania contejeani TaxID=164912 RepID=A0ABQ7HVZ6_9MICR|nr:E3 ubiquitin-protein ligase TOM1-like [Thelohania contejeani]
MHITHQEIKAMNQNKFTLTNDYLEQYFSKLNNKLSTIISHYYYDTKYQISAFSDSDQSIIIDIIESAFLYNDLAEEKHIIVSQIYPQFSNLYFSTNLEIIKQLNLYLINMIKLLQKKETYNHHLLIAKLSGAIKISSLLNVYYLISNTKNNFLSLNLEQGCSFLNSQTEIFQNEHENTGLNIKSCSMVHSNDLQERENFLRIRNRFYYEETLDLNLNMMHLCLYFTTESDWNFLYETKFGYHISLVIFNIFVKNIENSVHIKIWIEIRDFIFKKNYSKSNYLIEKMKYYRKISNNESINRYIDLSTTEFPELLYYLVVNEKVELSRIFKFIDTLGIKLVTNIDILLDIHCFLKKIGKDYFNVIYNQNTISFIYILAENMIDILIPRTSNEQFNIMCIDNLFNLIQQYLLTILKNSTTLPRCNNLKNVLLLLINLLIYIPDKYQSNIFQFFYSIINLSTGVYEIDVPLFMIQINILISTIHHVCYNPIMITKKKDFIKQDLDNTLFGLIYKNSLFTLINPNIFRCIHIYKPWHYQEIIELYENILYSFITISILTTTEENMFNDSFKHFISLETAAINIQNRILKVILTNAFIEETTALQIWATKLNNEFFSDNLKLFNIIDQEKLLYFPFICPCPSEHKLKKYRFFGYYIATVLNMSIPITLKLHNFVYKVLFHNIEYAFESEKQENNDFKNSYMSFSDIKNEQYFVINGFDADDQPTTYDLCSEKRIVTKENFTEYIKLIFQYVKENGVKKQLLAIKEGFSEFILYDKLPKTYDDFTYLFSGIMDIDVDDWILNTTYNGIDLYLNTIHLFFDYLRTLDKYKLKILFYIITGRRHIPLGGLKLLHPRLKIIVSYRVSVNRFYNSMILYPIETKSEMEYQMNKLMESYNF